MLRGVFLLLLMIRSSAALPLAMVETQKPWLADYIDQQDKDAGSNEVGFDVSEGN